MTFEEWWDTTLGGELAIIVLERNQPKVFRIVKTTAKLAFASGRVNPPDVAEAMTGLLDEASGPGPSG